MPSFLFATEDGTIVGWNSNLYPTQALCLAATATGQNNTGVIAKDNSAGGAVYKGLAVATDKNGTTFLYVTNFHAGQVEIYNGTWGLVTTFTDPSLPANYAPFNVAAIKIRNEDEDTLEDRLVVTFAQQKLPDKHDDLAGPHHGFVDTFNLAGDARRRFASGGPLNSPWGVALAPRSFGEFGGALLIGNFGDGAINAYEPEEGEFLGKLRKPGGGAVVIEGLWAVKFGNDGNGGSSKTLYFTAGPNGEADGLFGALSPKKSESDD